jgi:hypothetical protein
MTKRGSLHAIAPVWLLLEASVYADPVTLSITSGFLLYPSTVLQSSTCGFKRFGSHRVG